MPIQNQNRTHGNQPLGATIAAHLRNSRFEDQRDFAPRDERPRYTPPTHEIHSIDKNLVETMVKVGGQISVYRGKHNSPDSCIAFLGHDRAQLIMTSEAIAGLSDGETPLLRVISNDSAKNATTYGPSEAMVDEFLSKEREDLTKSFAPIAGWSEYLCKGFLHAAAYKMDADRMQQVIYVIDGNRSQECRWALPSSPYHGDVIRPSVAKNTLASLRSICVIVWSRLSGTNNYNDDPGDRATVINAFYANRRSNLLNWNNRPKSGNQSVPATETEEKTAATAE